MGFYVEPKNRFRPLKPKSPGSKPTTKPPPGPKGKTDMNNERFEIKHSNGSTEYVEVLNTFDHFYMKKKMYELRIHTTNGSYPHTIDQDAFDRLLKLKIKRPIGYAIYKDGTKKEIEHPRKSKLPSELLEFRIGDTLYRVNALAEWDNADQHAIFEYQNRLSGDWVKADIDRIELYEEHWK